MQAMPKGWQHDFVSLMDEFEDYFPGWRPPEGRYWVALKDGRGRYVKDPFQNYRHVNWTPEKVDELRSEESDET